MLVTDSQEVVDLGPVTIKALFSKRTHTGITTEFFPSKTLLPLFKTDHPTIAHKWR